MNSRNKPIGVFDSGVGGLSVLKELINIFPNENFKYLGDTLRMPYGTKKPEEVRNFTYECLNYLFNENIKAAVIACNTATCYGLEYSTKKINIPIIGVVEPACSYASEISKNKKIALIATDGTVKSKVYNKTIKKFDVNICLEGVGAPDLVLDIEKGNFNNEKVKDTIRYYLSKFKINYDTLILGCTHFPLAIKVFKKIYEENGRVVNLVDPANRTALSLKDVLLKANLLNDESNPSIDFYTTGNIEAFKEIVLNVINNNINKTFSKVNL